MRLVVESQSVVSVHKVVFGGCFKPALLAIKSGNFVCFPGNERNLLDISQERNRVFSSSSALLGSSPDKYRVRQFPSMKVVALRTASPRTIALVGYIALYAVGEESFDLQDTAWRPNLQRRPH